MPVAMISTSTSPAFGPSRSSSTISSGCLAAKAIAARVFMGAWLPSCGFGFAAAYNVCGALRKRLIHSPTRCIVVGRVQRGDGGVRARDAVAAAVVERAGEGGRHFRVELEGDRRAVAPGEAGIRREQRGGDQLRAGRRLHDLILVRGGHGDQRRIVHPGLVPDDRIAVQADAPALGRFLDTAAKRLGHDLVAEADADQLRPALRGAQEGRQRRDPGQILIDARPTSR